MYTLKQLNDLENIRQVARRYCRGVDRLDAAEMKSAYWPDAIDDHGAYKGNAWDFVDLCMASHLKWRSTNHCIMNHSIDLQDDGETATGEIYNVTYLFQAENEILDTWYGRYLDVYKKRGDEWRIAERICVHEGTNSQVIEPMAIQAAAFRQGAEDRHTDKA